MLTLWSSATASPPEYCNVFQISRRRRKSVASQTSSACTSSCPDCREAGRRRSPRRSPLRSACRCSRGTRSRRRCGTRSGRATSPGRAGSGRRRPRCSGAWRPKLAQGVLDNFFHRAFSHRLEALPGPIVEVHCSCPPELALERYQSRQRHPCHFDLTYGVDMFDTVDAAPTPGRSRSAARCSSSTRRGRSTSTRSPRGCALTSEARASRPTTARRCSRRGHVP